MPISPTQYEAMAKEMLKAYEDAELAMIGRVARRVMKGVDEAGWTEAKLAEVGAAKAEIRASIRKLRIARGQMLPQLAADTYKAVVNAFASDAERFTNFLGATSIQPNARRVAAIIAEAQDTLNAMDRVILRKANDAYTEIIAKVSARTATGTMTTRQATQQAVNEFAKRGIASFVDKAGRNWEMSTYAEMATLTAVQKSSIAGYTETMTAYGYELGIISNHGGSCPICEAWEGVIVSITGDNHEYPSLDEAYGAGVFHPRCIHEVYTYYEGVTEGGRSGPREIEGESESYSLRQQQRGMERQVRSWKRVMAASTTATAERHAYNRVTYWQGRIRDHIAKAPELLPRKYWREGGRQTLRLQ